MVLHIFPTLFLFFLFVFSVRFTDCFVLIFRCRYKLLSGWRHYLTCVFPLVSCINFCLGPFHSIFWSGFTTGDIVLTPTPLTPTCIFCPFDRPFRVRCRFAINIYGHPCSVSCPKPSSMSH